MYNSLSREVEKLEPHGREIKIFTCGPSVYRRPHIGNYRTFLYEDLLQRYLEYLGYEIVRLTSLTDIEDKAITEAKIEETTVGELAERNSITFLKESELLRMRAPTYRACMLACASTAVDEAVKLVKNLLEKGYAYYFKHQGRRNVYFDPLKFDGFGKLSRIDTNNWPSVKRRFHKDTYPGTRWNKGDFILWHGYKKSDADYWETEIGRGRPSWNIQDAASITKYLGFEVDIACGGIDNLARHHDYTIAVIEGVSGKVFARYWLHGQHLYVDGKKMSKTKGNVYYLDDLVKCGYSGEQIRFFLIYGHYRKRLNFTFEKMKRRSQDLDNFRVIVSNLKKTTAAESSPRAKTLIGSIDPAFEKNMNDDLNFKATFNALFSIFSKLDYLRKKKRLSPEDAQRALTRMRAIDCVLQVVF